MSAMEQAEHKGSAPRAGGEGGGRRFAAAPGVALLLLVLAGCASGPGDERASAETPLSPIERSTLRERALAILEEAATSENALLRANALEALHTAPTRIERFVRAGLADENLGVRYTAAMTVGELELRGLTPFIQPLRDDPSPSVEGAAIFALRRLGRDVNPTPLAALLRHQDVNVRARGAFILGELGDPSAIPMLKDAAKSSAPLARRVEDRILRLQIAEALVKLGEAEAVETVRAALYPSRPEDLEVAALAVQIIGEVGDRRSIDQLVYLTARTDEQRMPAEVRLAAAAALAKLGNPRGDFIADEYRDDSLPAIRAQAALVYGETAGSEGLQALADMLDDESPLVRVAAAAGVLKTTSRIARTGEPGRTTNPQASVLDSEGG